MLLMVVRLTLGQSFVQVAPKFLSLFSLIFTLVRWEIVICLALG